MKFSQWLIEREADAFYPLLDKIEEMPKIDALPEGMVPVIQVEADSVRCRIIYQKDIFSGEPFFYFYATTKRQAGIHSSDGRSIHFEDAKKDTSYPMNILNQARSQMEELAHRVGIKCLRYYSDCFHLSFEREFYDREALGYFMHLSSSGE